MLTDGAFWWGGAGGEWKRFSFADVMGISRAKRAGMLVTLISGENSPLVNQFAEKLEIGDFTTGCKDKAAAVRAFAERSQLSLSEVAFMGDDVNDLAAMNIVGLSAAPCDAQSIVVQNAAFVSKCRGGNGAVRDLIETILSAQGLESVDG